MLTEVRDQNHAMFKHTDRTRILSEKLVELSMRVDETEGDNVVLREKLQLVDLKTARKFKKTKEKIEEIEARLGKRLAINIFYSRSFAVSYGTS